MAEVDPPLDVESHSLKHQLSLEVRLRDDATLDNFLALPKVQPLVGALQNQLDPSGESVIYLYGPAGTGKSHLLQASCMNRSRNDLPASLGLAPVCSSGRVTGGGKPGSDLYR